MEDGENGEGEGGKGGKGNDDTMHAAFLRL